MRDHPVPRNNSMTLFALLYAFERSLAMHTASLGRFFMLKIYPLGITNHMVVVERSVMEEAWGWALLEQGTSARG